MMGGPVLFKNVVMPNHRQEQGFRTDDQREVVMGRLY